MRERLQSLVAVPCKVETLETTWKACATSRPAWSWASCIGGAGALVVGLFLVYNALSVSVAERRHDIGILRSVGAMRGQIASLFVMEAAVLGSDRLAAGAAAGLRAGAARPGPHEPGHQRRVRADGHANLELSWSLMLTAVAAGVLTTILAALVPALQAASEEPADAVRRVPLVFHFLYRVLQLSGSGLLMGGGLACVVVRDYLPLRIGVFAGIVLDPDRRTGR